MVVDTLSLVLGVVLHGFFFVGLISWLNLNRTLRILHGQHDRYNRGVWEADSTAVEDASFWRSIAIKITVVAFLALCIWWRELFA